MREIDTVKSNRDQELKRILEGQRARVLKAMRHTIRTGREEGAMESSEVQDEAEESEADVQSGLEFALLQMQSETLDQIAEALDRLEAGCYGLCLDCGAAIPARRLEALPFATRCVRCGRERETEGTYPPPIAAWGGAVRSLDAAR